MVGGRGGRLEQRRHIIGGDKGYRAGYMGVIRTDCGAMLGDCMVFWVNQASRRWGVLTDWNERERARGHNVRSLEYFRMRVQYSQNRKVPEERKGIRIMSLNIRLGRAGGLESALCALHQSNVNVRVL